MGARRTAVLSPQTMLWGDTYAQLKDPRGVDWALIPGAHGQGRQGTKPMTTLTDNALAPAQGRVQTTTGWVMTGLFAAFMVMDVGMKLAQLPIVEQTGRQLHLPAGSGLPIGIAEAAILALYLVPRTALLGAVLIAALMGGTAGVHLVNGNPWPSQILFGPYLAVFAWGGLWLRDARLRALIPVRR